MTKEEMWSEYQLINHSASTYEAWKFCGGGPCVDELATLVIKGIKTATASLYAEYGDDPIPQVGDYSIILYNNDEACCIVQTTQVTLCPFDEVSSDHAFKEGEQDRSLESWKKIHYQFFLPYFKSRNLPFDEKTIIVLEEFKVVFK